MKRLLNTTLKALAILLLAVSLSHAAERMAVSAETANVRSGPSQEHDLLWQVERFHPLMVIDIKGDWYRFKDFEGDQGWIHTSLLDKTPSVIVRAARCNVRTGPGTRHEIAFSVDKGIPFKVLQTQGQWVEVQHADGDKGWILNSLVW
jgi:SH3-like domain-containing protein